MDYLYLGKIVGTHGIKGEIRLISHFDKKEFVFVPDFPIYIGQSKELFSIASYRKHKNFDMITLKGINNINEVLKYKGEKVYVERSDLKMDANDYVLDDLIHMKIISNGKDFGVVKDIFEQNGYVLLQISFEKDYYIPYNNTYIKKVDVENKTIDVLNAEDLIL